MAHNTMVQSTAPSRQHYAVHYPAVFERAGLTDGDNLAPEFETRIRAIFNGYWAARNQPTIAAIREALEQYMESQAMVRAAMQSLGPIDSEIFLAADLANLPAPDREEKIESYLSFRAETDHLTRKELELWGDLVPTPDINAPILERDRGIAFLRDNPDLLARLLKRQTGDQERCRDRIGGRSSPRFAGDDWVHAIEEVAAQGIL